MVLLQKIQVRKNEQLLKLVGKMLSLNLQGLAGFHSCIWGRECNRPGGFPLRAGGTPGRSSHGLCPLQVQEPPRSFQTGRRSFLLDLRPRSIFSRLVQAETGSNSWTPSLCSTQGPSVSVEGTDSGPFWTLPSRPNFLSLFWNNNFLM